MILTVEGNCGSEELGRGFTFESAYNFLLERDSDPENPFYEGYDFCLTDNEGNKWFLEADCWAEVE